jgi:integrase
MLFKREGSPYYVAKWKHRGKVIYRNTKERTLRRAERREIELRSEFNREQANLEAAAGRFGCDESLLAHCPECNALFRTDRAGHSCDGKLLCSDDCIEKWNRRANPVRLLSDFLTHEFLPFVESRHAATKQKTATYYNYGVRSINKSDLAKLRLDQITSQHAAAYARGHAKLSPSTINCALRTLRHALNLAEEWGKLARAPRIPFARGERQRDRIVGDTEFAAYVELCRQPWRAVALLVRLEGMRPCEAYPLRWENVLFNGNAGLILITCGKSKAARRRLPMTPEVYLALKARHEEQREPESGWVFPASSRSGHIEQGTTKTCHAEALKLLEAAHNASEKLKDGTAGKWTQAIAEAAGLSLEFVARHKAAIQVGVAKFEPYCLRHTALTRFAESGCDAFTLAKIAGHSSITITQRYCHPQAEAVQHAFTRVGAPPMLPTTSLSDEGNESCRIGQRQYAPLRAVSFFVRGRNNPLSRNACPPGTLFKKHLANRVCKLLIMHS